MENESVPFASSSVNLPYLTLHDLQCDYPTTTMEETGFIQQLSLVAVTQKNSDVTSNEL